MAPPGAEEVSSSALIRLHEVLADSSRLLLVSELPPTDGVICTDLLSLIEQRGRLSEADARQIFAKLALAVKRAHDEGVMLRNIKPEGVQVRQRAPGTPWEVTLVDLHCAALVGKRQVLHKSYTSLTRVSRVPATCFPATCSRTSHLSAYITHTCCFSTREQLH